VRDFTILGHLPAAAAGINDITDMYEKRYGIPRAGLRVFIRTKLEIDGWETDPIETTAIVPSQ
jgi:hypothetical protein